MSCFSLLICQELQKIKVAQPCSSSDSEMFCNCIYICPMHILPFSWDSLVLTLPSRLQLAEDKAQGSFFSVQWVLRSVWLFATLWTAARQAPLSMEYLQQEYWCGLPFPPTADIPGITSESPGSPAMKVDYLPLSHQGSPLFPYPRPNHLLTLPTEVATYDVHHSVVFFLN